MWIVLIILNYLFSLFSLHHSSNQTLRDVLVQQFKFYFSAKFNGLSLSSV